MAVLNTISKALTLNNFISGQVLDQSIEHSVVIGRIASEMSIDPGKVLDLVEVGFLFTKLMTSIKDSPEFATMREGFPDLPESVTGGRT